MILNFDAIEPSVLTNFQGGQGQLVSRRHLDENNKITRGLLAPGCSIGKHTHKGTSEVIFVLSGSAKMYIDDGVEELKAGDCHYCPEGSSHSFVNDGTEDVVFYAVVPVHKK